MFSEVTLIWSIIIAIGIITYAILDGFVLGVGILFPFVKEESDKDLMIKSVGPVWDANQTWMVLGVGGLLAAFPLAYGAILSTLYLPLTFTLCGLIFRGISLEFRAKAIATKRYWSTLFALGSTMATFFQGVMLGNCVDGLPIVEGVVKAPLMFWLNPFTIFTGIALCGGYSLLATTWLILKTTGNLQEWCFNKARVIFMLVILSIGINSLWIPLAEEYIAHRWLSKPNIYYLSPLPILVLLNMYFLWGKIKAKKEVSPFFLTVSLFVLSYINLAISTWPYIVPRVYTIWEAAINPKSQIFLLIGVLLFLPLIIGYSAYSYWVFRGKVSHDDNIYHHNEAVESIDKK